MPPIQSATRNYGYGANKNETIKYRDSVDCDFNIWDEFGYSAGPIGANRALGIWPRTPEINLAMGIIW